MRYISYDSCDINIYVRYIDLDINIDTDRDKFSHFRGNETI